ncbi:MAG: ribosomal protein S18-alanine N-acetyltransferase [Deltaproteobacteria bacterium]|nr:ribosomal protein S18-alanine N-acetyltransferase [Deltaproteobacteria bacterium]
MERSTEKPREECESRDFAVAEGQLRLRPVTSSDLEDILAIEKVSYRFPWTPRFFLQELRVPCARSLLGMIHGKPVGYVIYWLLPSEIDIHNLAVHPAQRRQGIGRSLLQAVVDEARHERRSRITLEVRKSNAAAQRLYESVGFVSQGIRKGYYSDDGEDAVIMALEIHR